MKNEMWKNKYKISTKTVKNLGQNLIGRKAGVISACKGPVTTAAASILPHPQFSPARSKPLL